MAKASEDEHTSKVKRVKERKVIKPDRPKSAQAKLEPKWRRIVGFVMCEYIYIYIKDLRRGMSIYIYI